MLITKEVEVSINPKNINHYSNLGYKINKVLNKNGKYLYWGSKIIVKTKDITLGSNTKVEIQCDNCNKIKKWRWVDYLRQEKDGKTYCNKCSQLLFGNKKCLNTMLKNSKSLKQWCLDNNRQDILNRWDYKLNNCNPSTVLFSSSKKYYFKCPKGIHKSEAKNISNITNNKSSGKIICKQCNSFAQWGTDNISEDFLEKYWDYEKNTDVDPWKISYGSKIKIWIKCQEKDYHGSYEIFPNNFTNELNRCPYCCNFHGKVHPFDSLGKLLEDKGLLYLWSDKNIKTPYEYAPKSNKKVWWKCHNNKHEDYLKVIENATNTKYFCPECSQERNESILQEKVRLYLNKLGYTILHEYNCTIVPISPKTNRKLPFDNEIVELKLIIEVHGQQHYRYVGGYMDLDFKYRKIRDRYKRMFAKLYGYYYLEIPYKADNKLFQWKQMIDKKIKEINYIKQNQDKEIINT